ASASATPSSGRRTRSSVSSVDPEAAGQLVAALLELVDGDAAVFEAAVKVGEGGQQGILVAGGGLGLLLPLAFDAGGAALGLDERLLLLVALPLELSEWRAAVRHRFPLPVDGCGGCCTARRLVREGAAVQLG